MKGYAMLKIGESGWKETPSVVLWTQSTRSGGRIHTLWENVGDRRNLRS